MPKPETLSTSKAIREEAGKLAAEIKRQADLIHAENRVFTAPEDENWKKVNADYDALVARAKILERNDAVQSEMRSPIAGNDELGRENYNGKGKARKKADREAKERKRGKPTDEDRALCLQGWCRNVMGKDPKRKHREAARRVGVNLTKPTYDFRLHNNYDEVRRHVRAQLATGETRALAVNTNTAGGYTVPEGFVNNLEIALLQYGGILDACDVMRTVTGQDLPWPTVNDTTNKGAIITENTTVTPLDVKFGQIIFHAYKYTSLLVQVPAELLEDSAFDLGKVLGNLLGIRLGRIFSDHFTFGTGASQPNGIQVAATLGITAGASTAIAADELYKLIHSVDPAYRKDPSFGLMFNDQILLVIKLLKDGAGRYLWQSGLAGGAADRIDGKPYFINQSMASSVATTNITVLAGAFNKYKVRWVNQMRIRRLVERYADLDQEGFVAFMRADGNLLDAGTHPIKYLKQP